jgi:hypothetical protein
MQTKTHTYKDLRGNWCSESSFDMGVINDKDYILEICTMKTYYGIKTHIRAKYIEGNLVTFYPHRDYGKSIPAPDGTRCTQKTIEKLHSDALNDIETIKQEMIQFYQIKEIAV